MIEKHDIFESCNPRDNGRRIRIENYVPGHERAHIVSYPSDLRIRRILVSELHETPFTEKGERRKTGYFRVESGATGEAS